jgi:5-methylcytosine-specific restriction protein A
MPLPRPCVDCGIVVRATRCVECGRKKERRRVRREQRGYDSAWRALSKMMRATQPWCSRCRSTRDLTLDHIIPLSRGGTNDAANAQVLCRKCNSEKGTRQ